MEHVYGAVSAISLGHPRGCNPILGGEWKTNIERGPSTGTVDIFPLQFRLCVFSSFKLKKKKKSRRDQFFESLSNFFFFSFLPNLLGSENGKNLLLNEEVFFFLNKEGNVDKKADEEV